MEVYKMSLPEIKTQVNTYEVNAYCPECSIKPNSGCILRPTGEAFMTFDPTYQYRCENCHKLFESKKVYPRLEFEYETY